MSAVTRLMVRWMVAVGCAALLGGGAPASAAVLHTSINTSHVGELRLLVSAPAGTRVVATERGAAAPAAQVTVHDGSVTAPLGPWTCATRRVFTLMVTLPDGAVHELTRTARTTSCAQRVESTVTPTTPRPGKRVVVTLRDTWKLGGFTTRVCLERVGAPERCRDATIAAGKRLAHVTLDPLRAGRSTVTIDPPFARPVSRTLTARRAGGFTLLATGDSMIQIIDGYLKRRLAARGGRVISDAHISTGISKPAMLNWPAHARAAASKQHPDVTVVILGANDGFPFGSTVCCDAPWSAIYADRAAGMMRSYLRGRRGRVIWMLLPAPRTSNFATVFRGVNLGLTQAASRFSSDEVTLLDLRRTFTPGGSYRSSIRWNGRLTHVRQEDGVHFNNAGASIVADLIFRQLRRDGFVS